MVLLEGTLLLVVIATAECQINFPSSTPDPNGCTASNDQPGICYEFRSTSFKECAYYPSIDQSIPDVKSHLEANLCRNTGSEVFFCCPFNNSTPLNTATEAPRPSFIPSEDECGTSFRNFVVGGKRTQAGDWPWLAALGAKIDRGFILFCGATLITKQHVISAAHCFAVDSGFKIIVRLGEYDTNIVNAEDKALDFDIVERRVGNYNEVTKENDIILLKLDRPLNSFTDSIRPACLPYHLRNENFEEQNITVVGWGVFDNNDRQSSNVPLEALVPVVPILECRAAYNNISSKNVIDNRQLCAGRGDTDSCNGDSGGPINYLDIKKERFYVVGVVSFGPRICGNDKLPGVYARVGHYLGWIEENIREML